MCDFKSSVDYTKEAEILEQKGKYAEAIPLLDKALKKDPRNVYALINRGVDKSYLEDFEGAIEDYTKIIEIDSDNALAYLNRGKNKKRIGNFISAIEDFDLAIKTKGSEIFYFDRIENPSIDNGFEFDVEMEEIRFERGIAYYHIDSLLASYNDFNFCIQNKYEIAESLYHRGLIHIAYGNSIEGCRDLSKAHELNFQSAKESIDLYCNKE